MDRYFILICQVRLKASLCEVTISPSIRCLSIPLPSPIFWDLTDLSEFDLIIVTKLPTHCSVFIDGNRHKSFVVETAETCKSKHTSQLLSKTHKFRYRWMNRYINWTENGTFEEHTAGCFFSIIVQVITVESDWHLGPTERKKYAYEAIFVDKWFKWLYLASSL